VAVTQQQCRHKSARPNTIALFVPQQEAWVIEKFGKFYKVLEPVRTQFGSQITLLQAFLLTAVIKNLLNNSDPVALHGCFCV